jgi:hypothetical protein
MGEPKVGREVIARLVDKLGSAERAAARLGIRPGLVQRFVGGQSQVPDAVLLKALDAGAASKIAAAEGPAGHLDLPALGGARLALFLADQALHDAAHRHPRLVLPEPQRRAWPEVHVLLLRLDDRHVLEKDVMHLRS